jgi:hypothetical protein
MNVSMNLEYYSRPKNLRPDSEGVRLLKNKRLSLEEVVENLTAPLVDPSRVTSKELTGIQRVILQTYFPQTFQQLTELGVSLGDQ